jgi:CHASE1-domain containing sensor protein
MNADILALILAPAAILFLTLYLQQLAEVRRLRYESKAALDELAEAKKKIARDADHYREALRAAKEYYEAEVDGNRKEFSRAHILIKLQEILIDDYKRAEARGTEVIPGADAGA